MQAFDALEYLGGGSGNDTEPPVITNVASEKSRGGKFVVTWTTDEPATSEVAVDGLGTFSSSVLVTDHSITIRGKKGVLYTYNVTSVDAAGNSATAGPFTHQN